MAWYRGGEMRFAIVSLAGLLALAGCSSDDDAGGGPDAGAGGTAGSGGSGGGSGGSSGSGGAGGSSGAAGTGGAGGAPSEPRLRVVIETDIGGDRDDQSSFVRFLLYANEWDVEGILIDRHPDEFQNDGLAANPTGAADSLEMARDYIERYGDVHSRLVVHDARYPSQAALEAVTVAAHDQTDAGRDLLVAALLKNDPRPLWYGNWGSNSGTQSNLERALDWIQANEPGSYDAARASLRVSTLDGANPRLPLAQASAIPIYVETGFPQLGSDIESRWYRRFDDITGGYLEPADLHDFADLYMGEKEGDTWSFVYLLPNGLNVPEEPTWGGAAGRYLPRSIGQNHFWNDAEDTWNASTNRDNTAARWAEALQNDFAARLDWAAQAQFADANHPPAVVLDGAPGLAPKLLAPNAGATVALSLAGTNDPDGDGLSLSFVHYPEAGSYGGDVVIQSSGETAEVTVPADAAGEQIQIVVVVADDGSPSLTRYRRVVLDVAP